jgi:1,4-alpha-glucan branching enzyme
MRSKNLTKEVKFVFEAPEAKSVHVAGSFNDWDNGATPMKKSKGIWKRNIKLAPGTYEYRFCVDGEWRNDPQGTELKQNPFGTENNVLIVE